MSNVTNLLDALSGTFGLDRGGRSTLNALFDVQVCVPIPAVSADASATHLVFHNDTGFDLVLEEAKINPTGALTAAAANYAELTLSHGTVGAFVAACTVMSTDSDVAAGSGGTGNWVADTPESFIVATADSANVLANGEYVKLVVDSTPGSGVAVPTFLLCLRYRRN